MFRTGESSGLTLFSAPVFFLGDMVMALIRIIVMIVLSNSVNIPVLLSQYEAEMPFIYSFEGGQVCMMINDIMLCLTLIKSIYYSSLAPLL